MAGIRKTRSKVAPKPTDSSLTEEVNTPKQLPPRDQRPPKVFILPKKVSSEAKIVSLPSPANGRANRYLFCPENGLFEFTHVTAPKASPRSWLIKQDQGISSKEQGKDKNGAPADLQDRVVSQPDLFVATALDELYFLLPILCAAHPVNASRKATAKHLFLTLDDHVDRCGDQGAHFKYVVNNGAFRDRLGKRATAVCDFQEAGDETMFRLSESKLALEMYGKARRMVRNGLPPSMEERFVKRLLQPPVSNTITESEIKAVENGLTSPDDMQEGLSDSPTSSRPTELSQSNSMPTLTPATSFATEPEVQSATKILEPQGSTKVNHNSLRLRTAMDFLLRSYIPPDLRESLSKQIKALAAVSNEDLAVNFEALDAHLAKMAASRAEAVALRTMSDNITRKRTANSGLDDEQAEARSEKKRKKEEDDLKERNKSRALKSLKKVDISGMKTMQSFFQKAAAKQK